MLIYKITNQVNQKIYIGQTRSSTLSKRIASYKSEAKSDRYIQHRVVLAMRKYGFNNFIFEIIDTAATLEELNSKEMHWIAFYNSVDVKIGYNVDLGGFHQSPEVIRRRGEKAKGKKHTAEWNEKIRKSLVGQRHTEERKINQSKSRKARLEAGTLKVWNKGTKGIMQANSGSFGNGRPAPNKGRKQVIDAAGKIRYVKVTE